MKGIQGALNNGESDVSLKHLKGKFREAKRIQKQ